MCESCSSNTNFVEEFEIWDIYDTPSSMYSLMYNKVYKPINEKIITIYPYQAMYDFMKSLVTCYND